MNDRELLEMAAKAAGMGELVFMSEEDRYAVVITPAGESANTWRFWNPLHDDGDALRLAVLLGVTIHLGSCEIHAEPVAYDMPLISEPRGEDFQASTRRAITRAAAEIGRSSMQ